MSAIAQANATRETKPAAAERSRGELSAIWFSVADAVLNGALALVGMASLNESAKIQRELEFIKRGIEDRERYRSQMQAAPMMIPPGVIPPGAIQRPEILPAANPDGIK